MLSINILSEKERFLALNPRIYSVYVSSDFWYYAPGPEMGLLIA
jgi:hypothetical protein